VNPTTHSTDVADVASIRRGADAATLANAVYDRMFTLLGQLGPDDWTSPTDCEGWDVDDVVGHLLGAARGHASLREFARQALNGRRHADAFGGSELDAMNDLQVRDHADLAPEQKVAALREVAPRAVRRRTGLPRPLRAVPIPTPPAGSMPSGLPHRTTLGHLNDVVLTRDVLMHRIDIARAAGLDPALDDGADRRVVADVVAEWARRHGQPVRLRLTGAAGGDYQQGRGGPALELDAAEFCRTVSGRTEGTGLLATPVLF
jgi:uncharacterized protein (TIGR03083 family)